MHPAQLKRPLAVWFLIMITESIHGTLRTLYLEPAIGAFFAQQISVGTAVVLFFAITWFTMRWMRAILAADNSRHASEDGSPALTAVEFPALTVGVMWVVLTLIFEYSLGLAFGMSWQRMLEGYDITKGGMMGLGVTAMLFIPWVVNRLRKKYENAE
ncbi:MAG: hypothetical protein ABI583_13955 [Betaproteobacteria bacterium]